MAVGKNKLATKGGKRGGKKKCAIYQLILVFFCLASPVGAVLRAMIAGGAATDFCLGVQGS